MKRRIETSDDDSSEDESKFQEAAIAPDTLLQSNKLNSKGKLLKLSSQWNPEFFFTFQFKQKSRISLCRLVP